MFVFLGPDIGFCLIFTFKVGKGLFLPVFDEAQDKALLKRNTNGKKESQVSNCSISCQIIKLNSATEKVTRRI